MFCIEYKSNSEAQSHQYLTVRCRMWLPLLPTTRQQPFFLFSWPCQWSHARVSLRTALRLDDHGFQVPGASLSSAQGHPSCVLQPHGCHQRLCERHAQHSRPGWRDVPTAHRGIPRVTLAPHLIRTTKRSNITHDLLSSLIVKCFMLSWTWLVLLLVRIGITGIMTDLFDLISWFNIFGWYSVLSKFQTITLRHRVMFPCSNSFHVCVVKSIFNL